MNTFTSVVTTHANILSTKSNSQIRFFCQIMIKKYFYYSANRIIIIVMYINLVLYSYNYMYFGHSCMDSMSLCSSKIGIIYFFNSKTFLKFQFDIMSATLSFCCKLILKSIHINIIHCHRRVVQGSNVHPLVGIYVLHNNIN